MSKKEKPVKTAKKQIDYTRAIIACVLAWLVPGAGHLYLGKYRRAALFFASVIVLMVAGVLINGTTHSFFLPNGHNGFLNLMAGLGNLAAGLPHFVMLMLIVVFGVGQGDIQAATNEYGTTFIIVAAMLNILMILNAFDIVAGDKE